VRIKLEGFWVYTCPPCIIQQGAHQTNRFAERLNFLFFSFYVSYITEVDQGVVVQFFQDGCLVHDLSETKFVGSYNIGK